MEFSRVAIAVTSKSCNSDENYDGWEWVGDAVLKLLQTDSILRSQKTKQFVKFLHEGDLSMLRSGKSCEAIEEIGIPFSFCNLNLTSGALLFEAMGTNERLRQVNICDSL